MRRLGDRCERGLEAPYCRSARDRLSPHDPGSQHRAGHRQAVPLIGRPHAAPENLDSPAGFLESCRGVSRPTTEAAYLVNQRNAANAAVIAVEMRRPSAAAFNQSQTDKPGLRGGITPLSNNNIVETGESQYWATGGRVREYRLLNRVPITLPRIDLLGRCVSQVRNPPHLTSAPSTSPVHWRYRPAHDY